MDEPKQAEIVLEFDRVSLNLDGKDVLREVSFQLHKAETKVLLVKLMSLFEVEKE